MTFAPKTLTTLGIAHLLAMLRYRRPFGSESEREFIERFIDPLGPAVIAGNCVVVIPKADGSDSRTLFSCHTDTVHHQGGKQDVVYDGDLAVIFKTDGTPLGADDGSGVFMLLYMIQAGVPGTYVFHAGEECGGIGSSLMAETEPAFLRNFDRAIAFDRKGTGDVITHQMFDRCCSDEFGKALADALNMAGEDFSYAPSDHGVFTDTANYITLIPECTNLSVGYEGEHTSGEMQDVTHLLALAKAAVQIDWEALPTKRDPKQVEDRWGMHRWLTGRGGSRKKKNRENRHDRKRKKLRPLDFDLSRGHAPVDPRASVNFDDDDAAWREMPGYVKGAVRLAEEQHDDISGITDRYAEADGLVTEFFGLLSELGFDRAYQSLRVDELVSFVVYSRRDFDELMEDLEQGRFMMGEDDDIINFVRG